jgi:hypothetical protein
VAASGDAAGALGYFTAARFPGARQEDVVRDAYLELRLRRLVDLAAAKQCAAAAQGLGSLEAPDPSLPFTAQAIGALAKSVRLQYWLGMVEFACVDQSAARTRWEKLTKASPEISSADYAYTFLALWRLNPAEGVTQARKALGFLERQMGKALPEHQGKLLHSEGVLQAILGKKQEAAASFRAGAEAGPAGMIEYLNLDAIRWIEGMP